MKLGFPLQVQVKSVKTCHNTGRRAQFASVKLGQYPLLDELTGLGEGQLPPWSLEEIRVFQEKSCFSLDQGLLVVYRTLGSHAGGSD